ncbi:MAG TPA: hypothetical protein VFC78_13795 [Tepidisphaeraceae bacterium]|nr:hypothetical protein [Tepidisphaeraceae bacterium]
MATEVATPADRSWSDAIATQTCSRFHDFNVASALRQLIHAPSTAAALSTQVLPQKSGECASQNRARAIFHENFRAEDFFLAMVERCGSLSLSLAANGINSLEAWTTLWVV